jgi:hypothetical protein
MQLSRKRWRSIAGFGSLLLVVVCSVVLVGYWPFSQNRLRESLNNVLSADLAINHFRATYFPHPGCVAEGVSFSQNSRGPGSPPLVAIQRLTVQANYWDMLVRPHHIYRVLLEGLHIQVPPLHSTEGSGGAKFSFDKSNMTIGEIVANGAILEIERSSSPPLEFEIHELTLGSASANSAMSYRLALRSPEPPGEISSSGKFGPWRSDDPGQTSVSGSFTFDQADLGVFRGIAGIFSSKGSFNGALTHIAVRATVDVPNFSVTRSHHPVHLTTQFTALVDATTGDVHLKTVNASFLRTTVDARGDIVGKPELPRKLTTLDLSVRDGQIDDVLWLFVTKKHSPMSGVTSFVARVTIPPEGRPFLQEVQLSGDFGVGGGQFRPRTQQKIDELSANARGEKHAQDSERSEEDVISDLKGHVELRNGIATFSGLSFTVPGAAADLSGTYSLLNQKIDFHGTLKMDVKLAQTTTGVKSLLARVFAPMFNKKKGSEIPIEMDGTFSHPHFGMALDPLPKK